MNHSIMAMAWNINYDLQNDPSICLAITLSNGFLSTAVIVE